MPGAREKVPKPAARQPEEVGAQASPRVGSPVPLMRQHRKPSLLRLALPVGFAFVCGALVFALFSFLSSARQQGEKTGSESVKSGGTATVSVPESSSTADLPAPRPLRDLLQPQLIGTPAPPPAVLAQAVLEKFLAASSLEERIPLMESKASMEELAASMLAAVLPAVIAIDVDLQESPTAEQVVDVFFNVDFDDGSGTGRVDPQTVLVRIHGTQEPRVMADPFLDLFGGRLAAYAAAPQPRAKEFAVLANPMSRCWDDQVPNHEEKLTLKLMARDGPSEITKAYFGPQSEVALMLENPGYASSLSFGQTRACTIVLQWNTQDDPQRPYLEVLRMKAFSWNP